MQRHHPITALAAGDAFVLLLFRSAPADLVRQLGHPRAWLARVGTDAALVTVSGTALWLAAAWLGLGLVSAVVRRAPGRIGSGADRICAAVLPRVVLRLVAGSAGIGMLLAPLPAVAAVASTAGVAVAATASKPSPVPAPVWPSTAAPTGHTSPARPVSAPRWPSTTPPVAHPSARRDSATVQPGDCLWLIAARRLGPSASDADVAAAWPRWYVVNRSLIGADPNEITPGEVLQAPPAHTSEAPS